MKYSIEELEGILKECVSEKRYNHSILVMEEAIKYCLRYRANDNVFLEKVKRASLMHDICKEMSFDEIVRYIKDNNIDLDITKIENKPLIHGIIGADVCLKKYDFSEDMAKAIRWHTTGSLNMSLMDKIVFMADKVGRECLSDDLKEIKDISFNDLDEAIILFIEKNIERLNRKSIKVNELSIQVLERLKLEKN